MGKRLVYAGPDPSLSLPDLYIYIINTWRLAGINSTVL
jgi:hypothetical protein